MWLGRTGREFEVTHLLNALPFLGRVRGAERCTQELLGPCRATDCCSVHSPHRDQRRAGGRWTRNVARRLEHMAVRATDPQTTHSTRGKGTYVTN